VTPGTPRKALTATRKGTAKTQQRPNREKKKGKKTHKWPREGGLGRKRGFVGEKSTLRPNQEPPTAAEGKKGGKDASTVTVAQKNRKKEPIN